MVEELSGGKSVEKHETPEFKRAMERQRRGQVCCDKAERFFCVCRAAYDCPDHGVMHVGSHD